VVAAAAAGICSGDEGLSCSAMFLLPLLRLDEGVAYVVRTLLRPLPDTRCPVLLLRSVASLRQASLLPALALPGVTTRLLADPDPPPPLAGPLVAGPPLLLLLAAVAPGDTQCRPVLLLPACQPLTLTEGVAKAEKPDTPLRVLTAGVAMAAASPKGLTPTGVALAPPPLWPVEAGVRMDSPALILLRRWARGTAMLEPGSRS
jgi:hypothetical protein